MGAIYVQARVQRVAGQFAPSAGKGSMTLALAEIGEVGQQVATDYAFASDIGGSYPSSMRFEVRGQRVYLESTHRKAALLEEGSPPHPISGNPHLRFWWANEGRMFLPAGKGKVDTVNHPGFEGSWAVSGGYDAMADAAMDILDSYGLDLVM